MLPESLPYADIRCAEAYESLYTENPITLKHVQFELDLVEQFLSQPEYISWCDAACGTGWHLRNTTIKKSLVGVDREITMLNQARKLCPLGIQWAQCNMKDIHSKISSFDIISHWWSGYIHQETLNDVKDVILGLVKATHENGVFMIGLCNPVGAFEKVKHENNVVFENPLYIDAVIWRYTEPATGTEYENCIAPHPNLIKKWIEPYFKKIELVDYPIAEGSPKWQRQAFICTNRNKKKVID